jgi:hypothetical protein
MLCTGQQPNICIHTKCGPNEVIVPHYGSNRCRSSNCIAIARQATYHNRAHRNGHHGASNQRKPVACEKCLGEQLDTDAVQRIIARFQLGAFPVLTDERPKSRRCALVGSAVLYA